MRFLLLILLLLSCDVTHKTKEFITYKFEVSGNERVTAITNIDGEWLHHENHKKWEPLEVKGKFRDTLQIFVSAPANTKAVNLKIWIYNKLEYDSLSFYHARGVYRIRKKGNITTTLPILERIQDVRY